MKKYVIAIVVLIFVVEIVAVCNMAGGISRDDVEFELSNYVGSMDARLIVRRELCVDTNLLVSVSMKNLSSEAMTLLLLHPLFPQWRRSELIAKGKAGFYLENACLSDSLTDEDVIPWVSRNFVSESRLECALKTKSLSERSKKAIKQRIHKTLSYRIRSFFNAGH